MVKWPFQKELEKEKSLYGLRLRGSFLEPQLSLQGRKRKTEERKVFFFEKMKAENKEHWDSNKHHLSDSTSIIALYSRR